MALFGEKYGDEVRVVVDGAAGRRAAAEQGLVGRAVRRHARAAHRRHRPRADRRRERASAAGVRRIEALTGEGARAYLAEQDERVREAAGAAAHAARRASSIALKALIEERRQLERQLADAKRRLRSAAARAAARRRRRRRRCRRAIGGVKLMARTVQGLEPKDLRGLVDDGKKQVGSGIVAIVGVTEDGKAGLAVGVTDDLTSRISAVDLVKAGAEALGGKGGGGRPDMAQAGGPDGAKAEAALEAIAARIKG